MRGLESLIPNYNHKDSKRTPPKDSVFLIETKLIKPNPYQPRSGFTESQLKSLAESIKKYGILQPLVVSKTEKDVPSGRRVYYDLIAGERRLRAAKLIRLPQVPVIVRDSNPNQKLELSLIENVQREDLNPLEEANAYKQLIEDFGLSQSEVARRMGKSRPVIANAVRMLRLPKNILDAVYSGEISDGHTRPILSLKEEEDQNVLFDEIRKKKLSVRDTEDRARQMIGKKPTAIARTARAALDPELKEFSVKLKQHPDFSKAHIRQHRGKNIKLALEFPSREDFVRWIDGWLP